ncbi:MAG: CoB--CoM heterodisulfide reductase iron-sulfur subunit A family protein [Candidatus Hydrogenedentes bacterium]|nr:CoB--CoM heterodisulfide reductase iron-sulfur subunit A family protein [Candidatus Hydrogenedentota bacterium]
MLNRRIGVFICHCGGNISDYVDVEEVRKSVENSPGVVLSKKHMFTCSDAAQTEMMKDVLDEKLDGLVIASCSPKLHLHTFRSMSERAGLNPYRYVQVNIREQCSWAHTDNMRGATKKAIALVEAGIAKSCLMPSLSTIRVETVPKALIIGAGIAGLRSALSLARLGIHAYLIEREEQPGGWVGNLGELFPQGKKGPSLIDSLLEQVRREEGITLFTGTELLEKSGNIGNFTVKLKTGQSDTISLNVGAIIVTTGFDTYAPQKTEYGFNDTNVITLAEYERCLQEGTGEIQYNGHTVKRVAYIYCVGSRQKTSESCPSPNTQCSRYCCTSAIHAAILTHKRDATVGQYHLYRDIRTYGKYELLYDEALNLGSIFLRFDAATPPTVHTDGQLRVNVHDTLTRGEEIEIDADLVVLVTGMVPRENKKLVNILKLPIGKDGFFNEIHPKLRPVETVIDGVFIAGTCQSPKTISESVASALSAVSKTAGLLKRGYVELEPLVAMVDADRCVWCDECTKACPYGAIQKVEHNGKEVAEIIPVLCKGEGACVPVCPKDALDVEGYTDHQITAMIDAFSKEMAK